MSAPEENRETFPMRVAARLSGVTPERMRAWETRHDAIRPQRTPGGSRRYTHDDLDRLRLLRRVVEAGHRIGDVAGLALEELRARLPEAETGAHPSFDAEIGAVDAHDAGALRSMLLARRAALSATEFAYDVVLPLAAEIGRRWEAGRTSIGAEHLATTILRSLMLRDIEGAEPDGLGPRIVFATPPEELHDLGLLAAAVEACEMGADVLFLGANVPEPDLVESACSADADALALGFVVSETRVVEERLRALRRALPERHALWIGGRGIQGCPPIRGVDRIDSQGQLAAFVLAARGAEVHEMERPA